MTPIRRSATLIASAVSQQLSVILDVEELIPGPGYVLEVSSPGLDRALKRAADFERFRGRLAKISTSEPVDEAKFFEGRLAGFADWESPHGAEGKDARHGRGNRSRRSARRIWWWSFEESF